MEFYLQQIFAHSPDEFVVNPGMVWEPPCWIHLTLVLEPASEAARNEFLIGLDLPHCLDAFSRITHEEQLSSAFFPRFQYITDHYRDKWYHALIQWHDLLKEHLRDLSGLLKPPFSFVSRDKFSVVDLAEILQEPAGQMEMYLAFEKGKYATNGFLRIHTSLHSFLPKRYFWYQKRLPDFLEPEDIIPWLNATVRRLPKKSQPPNLQPWLDRLLCYEPDLDKRSSKSNDSWLEKPKITLVFGAANKVGYRHLFHLQRQNIRRFIRKLERVTIVASVQYNFVNGKSITLDWEFHLLTEDEAAANKVEQEMITGKKIHFGLDQDIVGMIAQTADTIHAINVPEEKIREICLSEGQTLALASPSRQKHKLFYAVPRTKSAPIS